jgi:hypothetical protein
MAQSEFAQRQSGIYGWEEEEARMRIGLCPGKLIAASCFDQAVAAVEQTANMDRAKVRAAFERRFTAERMVRDYLNIYQALAARCTASMRRPRKTEFLVNQISSLNRPPTGLVRSLKAGKRVADRGWARDR